MPHVIRSFRLAYEEFRHVIDTETGQVFLQRYEEENACWVSLLRFDPDCTAHIVDGAVLGRFDVGREHWLFTDATTQEVTQCELHHFAESLLDSEVTISKQWIPSQPASVARG